MRDYALEDLETENAKTLEENQRYEDRCSADEEASYLADMARMDAKDELMAIELDRKYEPISDPRALAACWMRGCLEAALTDRHEPVEVRTFIATILGRWYQAHPEMKGK